MNAPFSTRLLMSSLVLCGAGLQAQSRFVYTNNDLFSANSVSGFSVDANGALTQIAGSPFATGGGGTGGGAFAVNRITVAGGGKFLYASNGADHNISVFAVDASFGFLTPVTGSPFSAGATATWGDISLAGSPDGHFLFAGVASNSTVVTFTIGADGSLSQAARWITPAAPGGMKVSADGTHLAVGLP